MDAGPRYEKGTPPLDLGVTARRDEHLCDVRSRVRTLEPAGSNPASRSPRRESHQVTSGYMRLHPVTLGHKLGVCVGGIGVQLEFDWSRRERCALRNLESLSQVGVSEVQNGVVYLMQMHPNCRLIESDQKVTALKISQADAARWLKSNCPMVKHLELHRSTFRRGVLDWASRGVAQFVAGQIVMSFSELLGWHEERQLLDEELLAEWERVTERDRALPRVTASVSEGENSKKNLSFNPSDSGIFAELPPEVWDADLLSDSALYGTLREWWGNHGQHLELDVNQVTGAILAARTGKSSPIKYALTCLAKGVNEDWILKAANWRRRMKQAGSYEGYTAR